MSVRKCPKLAEPLQVQITPQRIEQYKASRQGQIQGSSINRELACLKTIFNKAIQWGYAIVNPVKGVGFFKEEEKPVKILSKEERLRLLYYASELLRPIIIMALKTGMRRGEILSLKWYDCDLQSDIISVRQTKSKKMREIPIHPELREILVGLRKNRRGPYVFCDNEGRKLKYHGAIRTSFKIAVRLAELGEFTFHDLRHNFASELVAAGVDLRTVQEYLGHSTLRMVQRYAHVAKGIWRSSIQLLKRDTPAGKDQESATLVLRSVPDVPGENEKVL